MTVFAYQDVCQNVLHPSTQSYVRCKTNHQATHPDDAQSTQEQSDLFTQKMCAKAIRLKSEVSE